VFLEKPWMLKYLIENELFITCPLLPTDRFIRYCRNRDINISEEDLEQFEKLGIFYPVARVRYPKVKVKGEEWSGEVLEQYAHFWFEKKYAKNWLEEGLLWEPSSEPFQAWETFKDKNKDRQIESFYSIFQCYTLYKLIQLSKMEIRAEWWVSYSKEDIDRVTDDISNWAKKAISFCHKNAIRWETAAMLCQIISNRYFPHTQSDRRSIELSVAGNYHDWNWYEYRRKWKASTVLSHLGMNLDEVKKLQESLVSDARWLDPLERWYKLVSFVSVEKKRYLKGKALLAQSFYSMEHMLRLFYEELSGQKLYAPDESPVWEKDKFYGKGVTQDELCYLEFLTSQYHLNPRPRLILVVEGKGEFEQFPRLARGLLGYPFSRVGIEIQNLEGIDGFMGSKSSDKYGALEKFIDYHHYRQTIVFVVLDNEGRVPTVKQRLLQKRSKYYPRRKVTRDEYIHVWKKNIEFDNFSHEEIARAMTELCESRYKFKPEEIEDCEKRFNSGFSLSDLFRDKLHYDLNKPKLLAILFGYIFSNPRKEFDENGEPKRPIVSLLKNVITLALRNYPPVRLDTWQKNQESGYFGDADKEA